jgi:murein DD-endopeptidase MepM/ murein hydrolase activator NlpD
MKKIQISEKNLKTALCVGASVMALTVVFLSVFALVQNSRSKKNPLPGTSASVSSSSGTSKDQGTPDVPDNGNTGENNGNEDSGDADKELGNNENVGADTVPDKDKETPVFTMPCTGTISKNYSPDELVFSMTMNDYRTHDGVDIACNAGDDVFAVAKGVIKNVYVDPLMGNCISIQHETGIVTTYKNLSDDIPENIVEGAPVICGQKIGSVGQSALMESSESAHLHIEMTQNGESIDPLYYIPFDENASFEG